MAVNQKMILTLTAGIMYWSLLQPAKVVEGESSPYPASSACSTITSNASSPTPSISGKNETSSICGEVSNLIIDDGGGEVLSLIIDEGGGEVSSLIIDDGASDTTTVSSQVDNEETLVIE